MEAPQDRAYLFGPLRLTRSDACLPLPALASARSLLAFLLVDGKTRYSRAVLAGLFWLDLPEARARRLLTQALWQIRRILPELIQPESEIIHINPRAVWVDVDEFRRLAIAPEVAALHQAVQLYQGDLLEGIYDDWALLERERLRESYLQVLEKLAALEKLAGRYPQALETALRLAQTDPLRESAHREVMRLHYALDHPEAALRQFETCRQVLQSELSLAPAPETIALAQEIRTRLQAQPNAPSLPYLPPVMPACPAAEIPLVGREQERAALLGHIDGLPAQLGGILLLEGEPGVGKSRLAQQVASDAAWRGCQVLWGRSPEAQNAPPFASLVSALQSALTPLRASQLAGIVERIWLQVLLPLLPELLSGDASLIPAPPLPPQPQQTRLVEAFARCLVGLGQVAPLLIILEDIHWAGVDTLDLLARLASRLRHSRVLILATLRGRETSQQLATWERLRLLDAAGPRGRILLAPLSAPQTSELIRRCLGMVSPAPLFEARLFQETAGNPLFVIETLHSLQDEGLLRQDAGGAWNTPWDETTRDYTEMPLPQAVERLLAGRLAYLSAAEIQVAQSAAVLGDEFDFRLLCQTGSFDPQAILPALARLVHSGFIQETPTAYRFTHSKMRQVTYQSISPEQRQHLHRQAGFALQALFPQRVEELAHHFYQGQAWEQALQYGQQAAQRASAAQANQAAAEHISRCLAILEQQAPFGQGPAAERRSAEAIFDLLAERSRLYWMQGQAEQQRADLERLTQLAARLDNPQRRLQALRHQALFLCETADDYNAARQTTEAALALSQAQDDTAAQAIAHDLLGRAAYYSDQYERAAFHIRQAIDLWAELGEITERPMAHIRLGRAYKSLGQIEQAAAEYAAALEIARASQNLLVEAQALTNFAVLARLQGDYRLAIQHNQQALRLARSLGHRPLEAATLDNLGVAYWSLRDYGQAMQAIRGSLEIVRAASDRRGMIFCLNNLGDLSRETGSLEQAQACLAEGLTLAREIDFPYAEGSMQQGLGRLHLEQSELAQAEACFHRALEIGQAIEMPALQGNAWIGLGLVELAREQAGPAAAYLEQALAAHTQAGESDYATLARAHLAVCRLLAGDTAEAQALSSQAMAELESHPGGEELAAIYYNHWQVMQACGQPGAAQAALEKAYAMLQAQAQSLPSPAEQQAFLHNIAVNRAIRAAQAAAASHTCQVRLPRADAPLGRALRPEEWVEVTWTVEAPQDSAIADKVAQRQARLLRLLHQAQAQGAAPTYDQLAQALRAGLRTIERDMAALARQHADLPPTRRG